MKKYDLQKVKIKMGISNSNNEQKQVKIRSVKFNAIMNTVLTLSSFIFPLITFPYVSRILQPEGTGAVSFANSIVMYFTMIASLGVPIYGIRACSKVRDNKEELSRTVQEILIINLVLTAFVYIAYFWAVLNVDKMHNESKLYVIMSLNILFNVVGVEWLYKGLEQYSYITVRSIAFKILSIVLMFLMVHQKTDYVLYGAITVIAGTGSNIFNLINLRKYIYLRPVKYYNFKRHLKPILVFFAMSVATTIYTNLDNVMLGFMTNEIQVGYYDAAVKIKNILVSFVTSLGPVLLPRATYYVETGHMEEFKRIIRKAYHFVWILGIPVMLYFIIMAKESIFLLSGESYAGSIVPMQIITPTVVLIGLSNVLGIQILLPLGKEHLVFVSEVAGAIVDLIINAILIPIWGAAGAAFGTLVAELVVLLVQAWALRNSGFDLMKNVSIWKVLTAVIASSTVCMGVKYLCGEILSLYGAIFWFIILAVTACGFFIVYTVVLLIVKENLFIELAENVWNKIHRNKSRRA